MNDGIPPLDFLSFIGICIAVFSFAFLYWTFLKDILNGLKDNSPDNTYITTAQHNARKHILRFFVLVDLYTGWLLIYLIFAIIIACLFLIARHKLAWRSPPHMGLRLCLFITNFIYGIVMAFIFSLSHKLRKNEFGGWWSYVIYISSMIMVAECIVFTYLFQFSLGWFFIAVIGGLLILLIGFVGSLLTQPLTELARFWGIEELKNGSEELKHGSNE